MIKSNFMSKRVYALPIVSFLETRSGWGVSMSNDEDPLFTFCWNWHHMEDMNADGSKDRNSWQTIQFNLFEIRGALFAINDPAEALTFFETYGPWQINEHLEARASAIRFSALSSRRDFFLNALLTREIPSVRHDSADERLRTQFEDRYLWQPLPMEMVFRNPTAAVIRCKDIQDAVRASVFLDRLDGFPWRRCAREDCGKFFKLESKHAKLFCGTDCANLVSSRSYNERKRANAAKARSRGARGRTTRKEGR
jgi:hypothetical protein